MLELVRTRQTHLWLLLVGLTLCSVELLQPIVGWSGKLPLFAAVLVIAFIKVRIVGLEFMELRSAPLPVRLMFEGWVIVVGGAMLAVLAAAGPSL